MFICRLPSPSIRITFSFVALLTPITAGNPNPIDPKPESIKILWLGLFL